ncbi:MAG: enoyl-CoA hydratase/isomerase family protein [Granulosicoccus sp.]|nr:enoyl-CoA hydratase/isomerase family protein [Granulosicoccus sp.]
MMTNFETLLITNPTPYVTLVTLNRPAVANAFNTAMATELMHFFESISIDAEAIRCVVVTGSGDRAFCAGGDLKERNDMTDEAWGRQHLYYERMIRAVANCPLPTVGAINGAAFGGGCELGAALDFCYASDNARFAMTEVTLGIIPGAGGTQNLSRAMGERRAKELILSGKRFNAEEAHQWGLINAVFSQQNLLAETLKIADKIAGNAPIAVRQAKQAIYRGMQMSLADGLAFEIEAYNRTVPTADRREGVRAFNEKRKPDFQGK